LIELDLHRINPPREISSIQGAKAAKELSCCVVSAWTSFRLALFSGGLIRKEEVAKSKRSVGCETQWQGNGEIIEGCFHFRGRRVLRIRKQR
jgi:hypothetical protein